MVRNNSVSSGGSCTVSSGPNKGKTGTYTTDDDGNVWCEGDWGGTECTGGKCSDAAYSLPVFEYTDAKGQVVYETEGLIDAGEAGVFQVVASINAETRAGRSVTTAPVVVTRLDDLGQSDEIQAQLAEAIRRHLEGQTAS